MSLYHIQYYQCVYRLGHKMSQAVLDQIAEKKYRVVAESTPLRGSRYLIQDEDGGIGRPTDTKH